MPNLNLSQFVEKTTVLDTDWTFIWDTAGNISKKVRRNSWLNSGTLTATAPVILTQTWNNAGVGFSGLRVLITDTASAAASNLLELWGGATPAIKMQVDKNGVITSESVKTSVPSTVGGVTGAWRLGVATVVSPTAPNRTIQIDIGGFIYYLAAKTTND